MTKPIMLSLMGKEIEVTGRGSEASPYKISGTGANTALAAVAEHAVIDHDLGKDKWAPTRITSRTTDDGRHLSVMGYGYSRF